MTAHMRQSASSENATFKVSVWVRLKVGGWNVTQRRLVQLGASRLVVDAILASTCSSVFYIASTYS